jgi:hypothetical protein
VAIGDLKGHVNPGYNAQIAEAQDVQKAKGVRPALV